MKRSFYTSVPLNCLDLRYVVYLSEVRKRAAYLGLSFILSFLCAYTERVSLMYSMTLSLQKALSRGERSLSEGGEKSFLFLFSNSQGDSLFPTVLHKDAAHAIPTKPCTSAPLHALSGDLESAHTNVEHTVRLIFTDVEEAFSTLLSVSLFWCVLVFLPVVLYHILCFFQPGLHVWQSERAWYLWYSCVFFLCTFLKVVDLLVIPRLLSFFYSFQIQRDSLCLQAETKVVSYISLYLSVFLYAFIFGVFLGLWGYYKQKQMVRLFLSTQLSTEGVSSSLSSSDNKFAKTQTGSLTKRENWDVIRYKDQRSKVWWGCLFLSALVSPPEVYSQCSLSFFFILLSEISIWFAYTSSCRTLRKTCNCT